MEGNSNLN